MSRFTVRLCDRNWFILPPMLRRSKHRILNRPPEALDSVNDDLLAYNRENSDVAKAQAAPPKDIFSVASFIPSGFTGSNPSAIHGPSLFFALIALAARIVSVVVSTIYYLPFRRSPHVQRKSKRIMPPFAHGNVSPSIIFIVAVPLVFASVNHTAENAVNSGSPSLVKAVFRLPSRQVFTLEAAATGAVPRHEIAGWDGGRPAALASAPPKRFSMLCIAPSNPSCDSQPSEFLARKINSDLRRANHFAHLAAAGFSPSLPKGGPADWLLVSTFTLAQPVDVSVDVLVRFPEDRQVVELLASKVFDVRMGRDSSIWGLAHGYNMGLDSSEGRASARRSALAFIIPKPNKQTRRIV